jgi:Hemerythrin HHE cation binding domain
MSPIVQNADRPEDLERQANVTREEVDRTLEALEKRFSIKRKIDAASAAVSAAAARATRWTSPEITTIIRFDHTHVLAAFRRYRSRLPAARKRALVANVCLGLEIHAQLEEEIFYPALFVAGVPEGELDQSIADHDLVRELIERLRQMSPRDAQYDSVFYELIRKSLHHVADEETTLLPLAEVKLKGQLRELGWEMTLRRLELLKPHMAEAASTTVMTFPVLTGLVAVGLCTVAWMLWRGATERSAI